MTIPRVAYLIVLVAKRRVDNDFIARLHNCPSQNGIDECKPGRLIFYKGVEFIYSRITKAGLASDRIR
jgi:hypothetical protein